MYLIDEQDDVALRISYFLNDAFQTLFELPFILGSGHKLPHIKRVKLLVLEVLRHISLHDSLG